MAQIILGIILNFNIIQKVSIFYKLFKKVKSKWEY